MGTAGEWAPGVVRVSLIRDDDAAWVPVVGLVMLAVVLVSLALLETAPVRAQVHKVTLHGKLFKAGEGCAYALDPEGDSQSVTIDASSSDYLCDYLEGSNAKPFTVILEPE